MALQNSRPALFRPTGLSDALDGTNSFQGSMLALSNLIPSPTTKAIWVPRPAAVLSINFTGHFTTPATVSAQLVIGTKVYGMIGSADFAGKDVPFCYNMLTATFETITGRTLANLPATQATTGDWTPPVMAIIGSRIIVTHPGFSGGVNPFFGWLDISDFSSATLTGDTHNGTKIIDNLSASPITAGVAPGMTISGVNIPANTRVISVTATSITTDTNSTGSLGSVTLTIAGGTAASPQWGAGNTSGFPLVAVPLSVAQFNGRAYYAVGNGVQFSDALNPTQITNASQALTFNNGLACTALAGLPLNSTSLGGIIQSLICFQGDSAMQQITGDQATSNLALNALNVAVGTLASNTITPTPLGLAFVSSDGLRIIDFFARVSDPIGAYGDGVCVPFLNAVAPTRMCAAFNQNVLRITVQNGAAIGQPFEEYWYDFSLKTWSGPHSFGASMIDSYQGSPHGFLIAPQGVTAKIFLGQVTPNGSSVYTENGNALAWTFQTSLMPDNQMMTENSIVETAIMLAIPGQQSLTLQCLNDEQSPLDTVFLSGDGSLPTVWGSFTWGGALWGGGAIKLFQYQIPWSQPLVFKQMSIRITGNSIANFAIGNLYNRFEILGYLLQRAQG